MYTLASHATTSTMVVSNTASIASMASVILPATGNRCSPLDDGCGGVGGRGVTGNPVRAVISGNRGAGGGLCDGMAVHDGRMTSELRIASVGE